MALFPHRFRPPKRTDNNSWKLVKFLYENGFNYQHIYENGLEQSKKNALYVKYPKTIMDAKEFVEKYKTQAIKKVI